jgi:hypothetical protein
MCQSWELLSHGAPTWVDNARQQSCAAQPQREVTRVHAASRLAASTVPRAWARSRQVPSDRPAVRTQTYKPLVGYVEHGRKDSCHVQERSTAGSSTVDGNISYTQTCRVHNTLSGRWASVGRPSREQTEMSPGGHMGEAVCMMLAQAALSCSCSLPLT